MNRKNRASLMAGYGWMAFILLGPLHSFGQKLQINDSGYFETPGVNVLVFNSQYNGMFFDEKTYGIEMVHHGVRTVTGGAVRLQNTPEQWDLIPTLVNRTVDKSNNSINIKLRYNEFDFNTKIAVVRRHRHSPCPGGIRQDL